MVVGLAVVVVVIWEVLVVVVVEVVALIGLCGGERTVRSGSGRGHLWVRGFGDLRERD